MILSMIISLFYLTWFRGPLLLYLQGDIDWRCEQQDSCHPVGFYSMFISDKG